MSKEARNDLILVILGIAVLFNAVMIYRLDVRVEHLEGKR